ncbi:MAG: 3-dehydroquinate synthase [Nitrospiria bacterium]
MAVQTSKRERSESRAPDFHYAQNRQARLIERDTNLILVGPMGSGKTTIGRRLAETLGWSFVDTDHLIEREAGASVAEIFRRGGEPTFRALERRIVARVTRGVRQVIATGGGALLDSATRRRLMASGLTVWLKASPEILAARLVGVSDRPLLVGSDPQGALASLLAAREPLYRQALIHVETGERSPDQVREDVMRSFRPDAASVIVSSSASPYSVEIGWNSLSAIGPRLAALGRTGRIGVVAARRVGALFGPQVCSSLRGAGFRPFMVWMPDGERYKTLRSVSRIYDALVSQRFERGDTLLGLGGGVIGDLTGFAAATYLRGVAYVHVPTTVVAQVDSSIGGKTGVDHSSGKNLIGAFHHPVLVWTDVATLTTLPQRELVAGLAEVVKYGVIADASLFQFLEERADAILGRVPDVLTSIVRRSAEIKASVVAADEREHGLRRTLNYGHTVGHVVETCTGYGAWRHGEAVAVGMDFAARLAQQLGLGTSEVVRRQRALLERVGLPWKSPAIPASAVARVIALDKKVQKGRIHFVLPSAIGTVSVEPVDTQTITDLWRKRDR